MVDEFSEGEEYELDKLPENEMTRSGKLEMVGNGKLGARFGDEYVEFEWSRVRCTDVTKVSEL